MRVAGLNSPLMKGRPNPTGVKRVIDSLVGGPQMSESRLSGLYVHAT
jgi:hypothetical protein